MQPFHEQGLKKITDDLLRCLHEIKEQLHNLQDQIEPKELLELGSRLESFSRRLNHELLNFIGGTSSFHYEYIRNTIRKINESIEFRRSEINQLREVLENLSRIFEDGFWSGC